MFFGRYVTLAEFRFLTYAIAFAGLAIPIFMMGVSLPLLSCAVVKTMDRAATEIGVLYCVNTLGAGVGALAAGWWLIGNIGYDGTILVGACTNILVGLGAISAARRTAAVAEFAATRHLSDLKRGGHLP